MKAVKKSAVSRKENEQRGREWTSKHYACVLGSILGKKRKIKRLQTSNLQRTFPTTAGDLQLAIEFSACSRLGLMQAKMEHIGCGAGQGVEYLAIKCEWHAALAPVCYLATLISDQMSNNWQPDTSPDAAKLCMPGPCEVCTRTGNGSDGGLNGHLLCEGCPLGVLGLYGPCISLTKLALVLVKDLRGGRKQSSTFAASTFQYAWRDGELVWLVPTAVAPLLDPSSAAHHLA
eukprot:1144280-Pelagomonas_calceolata.AAC.4